MKLVNVIVTGSKSSGKSTFLKSLSQHVFTAPEEISSEKADSSCAVEYGRMQVDPDTFLYLVALSGNESFQFIWERLAKGLLGFVVVFDAKGRTNETETKELIRRLKNLTDTPFVVVFNRLGSDQAKPAELKKEFRIPREEQVICCDVADRKSAKNVLLALLKVGVKQVKKMDGAAVAGSAVRK